MKSIGILGGGQLAQMLALKAPALGLKACALSPSLKDPVVQTCKFWKKGDPYKVSDLNSFLKTVDVLTFESEFIPAQQIEKALKKLKSIQLPNGNIPKKQLHIAPSLSALAKIQDRWTQKNLLLQYQFHTASFVKVTLKKSFQNQLLQLWNKLGPFVLKSRTGGYDGYGTFTIKRKTQIKNIKVPSGSFIAEKFISFKRELAMLTARNKAGQIVFFPLMESFQKNSKCLWVKGPIKHKKWKSLKQQITKFLNDIDYQGLMAFELFDIENDLMINELAPRVHNSGHYSLDALSEDQFTMHLKAICNLPLKNPIHLAKGFAMLNLLGEGSKKAVLKGMKNKNSDFDLNQKFKMLSNSSSLRIKKDIFVWWYGKTINRKGRKLGHINTTASSANKALDKLLKVRHHFKV